MPIDKLFIETWLLQSYPIMHCMLKSSSYSHSKCAILTSVWPSRSKIGRGQKVGQSKTFSNHGLWHTKMTGMMSRMQNCHSCLPNFPRFGDIHHFVFSQCYPIGPDPWKWQSSMSIISIMDPFQWFGTLIYLATWCIHTIGSKLTLTFDLGN